MMPDIDPRMVLAALCTFVALYYLPGTVIALVHVWNGY